MGKFTIHYQMVTVVSVLHANFSWIALTSSLSGLCFRQDTHMKESSSQIGWKKVHWNIPTASPEEFQFLDLI